MPLVTTIEKTGLDGGGITAPEFGADVDWNFMRISQGKGREEKLVFGLKSRVSNFEDSTFPTNLFSLQIDGTGFTDIGAVKRFGGQLSVDVLALSAKQGLFGFKRDRDGDGSGYRLVSINPFSAKAIHIGRILYDRNIRGAVFSQSDELLVLDVEKDELLKIDSATGKVIGSPISLTLNGSPFNLSNACDIAMRLNGNFVVTSGADFYRLDIQSGTLSSLNREDGKIFPGIAFLNGGPEDALFSYEVNDTDDIFRYDLDSDFLETTLVEDILPDFNAGRGDLASIVNAAPIAPALVFPENGKAGVGAELTFGWNTSSDSDGDTVTYDLLVCENADFTEDCVRTDVALLNNKSTHYAQLSIGLGVVFGFVMLGSAGNRRKIVLSMVGIMTTGLILTACGGGGGGGTPSSDLTQTVSGLKAGTNYTWKVIANDGRGGEGESESETRNFSTQ